MVHISTTRTNVVVIYWVVSTRMSVTYTVANVIARRIFMGEHVADAFRDIFISFLVMDVLLVIAMSLALLQKTVTTVVVNVDVNRML